MYHSVPRIRILEKIRLHDENSSLLRRFTQFSFQVPFCITRFTVLRHSLLSRVNSNCLFKVGFSLERSIFMLILLRSCRIFCIQDVYDLPLGLFTFLRCSSRAFLAGVSDCSLIKCPRHANILTLITWLHNSYFVLA